MTQDTRKDRRVKIVSLNVRYKSATVDEFIENHAHDVSRGGIYIKTANPFPQGTLLKFEIRLSSDQTVITGVGRVVWKREAAQGEQPAGMGVKFIKVDDSSKVVIDRLVTTKSDAGKAFESEPDPTAMPRPSVPVEGSGAPSSGPGSKRPYKPGPPLSAGGSVSSARQGSSPSSPSSAPRPIAPSPLFPKSASVSPQAPKQEQTVMKQAAELLEEALREAGGSMEEVGTNPLFTGDSAQSLPKDAAQDANASHISVRSGPPALPSTAPVKAADHGAAARGMVAALSPGHAPGTKGEGGDSPRRGTASSTPAPKARGSRRGLVIGAVVVVAVAAVALNRDKLFGSPPEPVQPAAVVPAPPPSPPTSASAAEAPTPSASAAQAPSAEPSSQPTTSVVASGAGEAPSASAVPSAKPVVQAPKAAIAAPPPAPAPTPAATATGAPSDSSGSASTASTSVRPAPKLAASAVVKPAAAKPAKPDNDNPY
jgi:uncharacterized protein (TIGR02266 family)